MLSVNYISANVYFDWRYFLVPFTNWTLFVTTLSIMSSFYAASEPHYFKSFNLWIFIRSKKGDSDAVKAQFKKAKNLQLIHHVLYSLSILMNLFVVIIYWFILHKGQMEKHKDFPGRIFHLYYVHSTPAFACLVNSYITNCVLNKDFWKIIPVISTVYYVVLFVQIQTTGKILYFFITFRDIWTPIAYFTSNFGMILVYKLLR